MNAAWFCPHDSSVFAGDETRSLVLRPEEARLPPKANSCISMSAGLDRLFSASVSPISAAGFTGGVGVRVGGALVFRETWRLTVTWGRGGVIGASLGFVDAEEMFDSSTVTEASLNPP